MLFEPGITRDGSVVAFYDTHERVGAMLFEPSITQDGSLVGFFDNRGKSWGDAIPSVFNNKNKMMYWAMVKTEKIYSMVADLKPLIETQRNVINALEKILERDKKVVEFIETEFERYIFEHKTIKESPDSHKLFQKFLITRRISVDFNFLKATAYDSIELKRNKMLTYPTAEDLEEAVDMISRLQRFYSLNVTQLADGLLNTAFSNDDKIYTEVFLPMTVSDCYEIGKLMYLLNNHKLGLKWFLEAIRLYDKKAHIDNCKKVDIIKNICEGYKTTGGHKKYVEWAKKMIEIKPSDDIQLGLNEYTYKLHQMQKTKQVQQNKKIKKKILKINPIEEVEKCLKGLDRTTYRMFCRGEVQIASSVSKRLKCWYDGGHHPFTKLARFRTEQLYIHPNIYLFHNIISDTTIETLKHISSPQLKPSITVNGPTMMTSMVYQFSKGTELNTSETDEVSRRISDFTGLNTASSQFLVSNYGVGGYYVGHVDGPGIPSRNRVMRQFNLTDANTEKIENLLKFLKAFHKIASVIIYLSEVEQGGATVFPVLGLSQFPVKGAALFWHNLLPSGDMDYATCHGVCPVLRGSRWVASQFIDNESQLLHQPCKMKTTSRRIEDIPHPVIKVKTVNLP